MFFANTSLYIRNNKWYLIQFNEDKYQQISLESSDILDAIIKVAENGVTFQSLTLIFSEYGFTENEIDEFIQELLNEQVFFTSFRFRQSETLRDFVKRNEDLTRKIHKTVKM